MRAFLILLALAGCGGEDPQMSVFLTGAPSPNVIGAVVTIDGIYFQGEGGRTVLRSSPITVDLLALSDDVAAVVDDASIFPGTYEQLRFVISEAYIQTLEGAIYATPEIDTPGPATGELQVPSWDTNGFKVSPEQSVTIEGEQENVLVVEFDVAESFGQDIGSGAWVMRPVLRATDYFDTGSIVIGISVAAVALDRPLQVELFDAAGNREGLRDVIDDDADGYIETDFPYLDPRQGPFTLTLPGVATEPATPIEVTLGAGEARRFDLNVVSVVPAQS